MCFKGEIALDGSGQVARGYFGAAGLEMILRPADGRHFGLVVTHGVHSVTLGVTDLAVGFENGSQLTHGSARKYFVRGVELG